MSVFRVKLQNSLQGRLDVNPTTGQVNTVSGQRTIDVAGPNKSRRILRDGDTFTDSNYWKRFAYPAMSLEDAFIEVVTDDGSIYSDFELEQTFLKNYAMTIEDESTYTDTDNIADIVGDTGGYAVFTQIANNGNGNVSVRINGSADSTFILGNGETQIFNLGELAVSKVAFANSSGSDQDVQVMVSVRIQSTS